MKLKVIIEPGEDGGFIASVPALRGCHTQGSTPDEVMANVREAIEGWLEAEQDKADRSGSAARVEMVTV